MHDDHRSNPKTAPLPQIRDAATVILTRKGNDGPEVLMGQRGAKAAFMPSKYVFPGGAVDTEDTLVDLADPLSEVCARRLAFDPRASCAPSTLAATAIRELWEETGLALGRHGRWPRLAPRGWEPFARAGILPYASPLRYIFRAVTPPGRTRRFDARFFLADAGAIQGDPNDFSKASDELAHLHWVPLTRARSLDLPFITEIVLAEVAAMAGHDAPPLSVPFFDNTGPVPTFRRVH